MVRHMDLNNEWKYFEGFEEQMLKRDYDDSSMEQIRIPHTNRLLPYHYINETDYQFISCYRRHLFAEQEWKNKQVLLTFEAVGHIARVYVNGIEAALHEGGYTAFTVNISELLQYGEDNVIAVMVDSRECNNLPPFGNVIDYLTYGGIYREVSLDIKEQYYIDDVYVRTRDFGKRQEGEKAIDLSVKLNGPIIKGEELKLDYTLLDDQGTIIYTDSRLVDVEDVKFTFNIKGVREWDIDDPNLYFLKLELAGATTNAEKLDEKTVRFGFRTCEFKKDGFYLNHRRIKLIGINRHQSYPYVGYAMPKRQQQRDAEILKKELKVNAVRTSHYPQSRHFLDRCDELGLLVFTEIPGWQHIGDSAWKDIAVNTVREMVLQYRNHPSIILWGVRINESQDDDEFYTRTNRLAHELDPDRQTGGVRYLKKSNLLEDVYTYNDFLHDGTDSGLCKKEEVTSNTAAPYLVTEFNGHMFPTKSFDNEEHRLEHALRHARVLDAVFEQEELAGGFGWCMVDYNTHKDFGSGDRICYHGVMDMFRNPKQAAAVYASQSEDEIICEVNSTLDIGDHPAGNIKQLYAFTNADSIRLYKNDMFIREFYPSGTQFKHLPHPPILIDDLIGDLLEKEEGYDHRTSEEMKRILYAVKQYGPNNLPIKYKLRMAMLMFTKHLKPEEGTRLYYKYIGGWGGQFTSFRFEAIRDNQVVKTITKAPAVQPKLIISADTQELIEGETYDVAAIRIKAVDANGNLLPYYQEPVTLCTSGAVALIGPVTISLKGGYGGTYVRTIGRIGEGMLYLRQADLGEYKISFSVSERPPVTSLPLGGDGEGRTEQYGMIGRYR